MLTSIFRHYGKQIQGAVWVEGQMLTPETKEKRVHVLLYHILPICLEFSFGVYQVHIVYTVCFQCCVWEEKGDCKEVISYRKIQQTVGLDTVE